MNVSAETVLRPESDESHEPSAPARSITSTTRGFRFIIVFVLGAAIAFAFQLHRLPAVFFAGEIIPADNDAFYHARRILDTAADPAIFYEFDQRIHAPEGSLLVWPWGFDYIMAAIVRSAVAIGFTPDAHLALAYAPPFAAIISVALLTLIAWNLGLSTWAAALLVLSVAVSPLTQMLHGIGCVDHHFAEYIFILGFLAASTGWLRNQNGFFWPIVTGLVLGFAPAIHTLLFILQLPLLIALAVMWSRGISVDRGPALAFSTALLLSTVAATAPSLPLVQGYFEHYYLSWFHVYVAACTALATSLLSTWAFDRRHLSALFAIGVVLTIPLLPQLTQAAGYLDKGNEVLSDIAEAKSVLRIFHEKGTAVLSVYSGLVLLAPAVLLGAFIAIKRSRDPAILLIAAYTVLALPLLLSQFRFHYYGSICLILPLLLFAERSCASPDRRRLPVIIAVIGLIGIAMFPAVKSAIASEKIPARDPYFVLTRLAMPELAAACQSDPGIVLAKNNDGHYIRYYTECSVIANNFLLTPQQVEAVYTVADLFNESPVAVARSSIPIKYVLVRARGVVYQVSGGHFELVDEEDARSISDPLTDALLWGDVKDVPAEFELIAEIMTPTQDYPYARIWKITSRPL